MIDSILLSAVRRGSENALGQVIERYTAYICVVIRNTTSEHLTHEDIEETASDVFFALWENAGAVEKLKPWLSATARNKAKNKLREIHADLPLDDELAEDAANGIENSLISEAERKAVKSAILMMDSPDSDIFMRFYYDSQPITAIAEETDMTEAAVKMRLVRGRKRLRQILDREVFAS